MLIKKTEISVPLISIVLYTTDSFFLIFYAYAWWRILKRQNMSDILDNERRSENIAVIDGPPVNLSIHAPQVDVSN